MRTLLTCIGFLLLGWPTQVNAQGWQRIFGGAGDQRAFALQTTSSGGFALAGSSSDSVGGISDWYFLQTDAAGTLLGASVWGDSAKFELANALLPRNGGGWWLGGAQYDFLTGNLWYPYEGRATLSEVAVNGQTGATFFSDIPYSFANGGNALNSGPALWGAKYIFPLATDGYTLQPFVTQFDHNGAVLWSRLVGSFNAEATAAASADGEHLLLSGYAGFGSHKRVFTLKIDNSGTVVDSSSLALPWQPSAVLVTPGSGTLTLVGKNTGTDADVSLLRLSADLDSLGTYHIPVTGQQQAHAALLLPDGDLLLAGENIPTGANSRDAFLARTDPTGNLRWFKVYGGLKGDIFWDAQPAPDGNGWVLAGQSASFSTDGALEAWLVRTDSLGNVWSNQVTGRVVLDSVQNCSVDSSETPLRQWLVTAAGCCPAMSVYTLTDSLGQYALAVDTGVWHVSVLPPSPYWSACEDSTALNFPILGDTLSLDFPIQAAFDCPLLAVDVTTPFLRRCFENTFYVQYFNYGTRPATDAVVQVVLDPYLSATQGSLPYTSSGDTLFFPLGNVGVLSGGQFTFKALLDCDSTVLGQTHCVEAHIWPDSLCYQIDPQWDGANVAVNGYCAGDSVLLTISNTGNSMQGPVEFVITEDQIIFRQAALQLAAGQDTTLVLYPNGATVFLSVDQTPGHPLQQQATLLLEGCGDGPVSTGYALLFPDGDNDPFTDQECRQNVGSFDPNDKQGLPLGWGPDGVIPPNTPIEYLIRFQNTGTDTAFRVEIRDTLTAALDLRTFRVGASSHPYQLAVTESGILHFIFDPIALPDSTTDWAASQGFVKFSMRPYRNLADGARIENRAAIYFDFNAPVFTNTTVHTIGDPYEQLTSQTNTPNYWQSNTSAVMLQPNPAHESVLVSWPQARLAGTLELRDLLGRLYGTQAVSAAPAGSSVPLSVQQLPTGVYFLIVKNEAGATAVRLLKE